jgi:hypothetical protein
MVTAEGAEKIHGHVFRKVNAEAGEKAGEIIGPGNGDGDVADGIFEEQIPANDPGDEFAEGSVGVGVGTSGNGNHRSELGVAEGGERTGDGDEDKQQ